LIVRNHSSKDFYQKFDRREIHGICSMRWYCVRFKASPAWLGRTTVNPSSTNKIQISLQLCIWYTRLGHTPCCFVCSGLEMVLLEFLV
jgi:hypothetical protein